MIFNPFQLTRLLLFLGLLFFATSCSQDNVSKAQIESTIDVLIMDGKIDVKLQKNYEVISEFKNVDSFRVKTDVKLEALLTSKDSSETYLHLVPGIAAERDKQGIEKIYLILGSEKEKAASIKKDFNFQLTLINSSINDFVTRYSHYENIKSFYDNLNEPRFRKKHVWGASGSSAFEKRHQQRIIEKMKLVDIFENEFYLKPLFKSNNNPFLSNLRSFEVGFQMDSLFVIGIEKEVLTVQLNGKWKLFNDYNECVSTYPVKTFSTSNYYKQENIVGPFQTSKIERVISEAFLNTLTNSILSEFKEHLTSAKKIREEDSLRNLSLGKLKIHRNQVYSSFRHNLKENQRASVAVIGKNSTGSGSVISSDGYILTNYHVIAEIKDNIEVVFSNGKTLKAKIARTDREIDAAILKVDTTGLFTTTLAPNYKIEVGEKIHTIATPQNVALINTVSFGYVSALRNIGFIRYIQSDGNFLRGTSGGPLFNQNGQQIGINVLGWQNNGVFLEGLNFAIPVDVVIERLNIQQ